MPWFKKVCERLLLSLLVLLGFLAVFEHRVQVPAWLQIAGRIHPLFVHFPIVLVVLMAIADWLPLGKRKLLDPRAAEWLRLGTALAVAFSALFGFFLSLETRPEGSMFFDHKWMGIGAALLVALYYSFFERLQHSVYLGRAAALSACVAILLTGHWGGNLTHGRGYLLQPLQAVGRKTLHADQALIFPDVIKPLLDAKCMHCHNSDLAKGGLVMETAAALMAGGKSGIAVVAGQPASSLLIQRILLATDERKHMPPPDKAPLSPQEIQLLQAWIQAGAPMDVRLSTLPFKDSFRILAQHYLSGLSAAGPATPAYSFAAAPEKQILALNNNYRVIEPLGQGSPALSVHFYGRQAFRSQSLQQLEVLQDQITELSLSGMPVGDKDLAFVARMKHLRRLNLNHTLVTDAGMQTLLALGGLQEISLSGTAVTAQGVQKILQLPEISAVYLWNSKVEARALASLRQRYSQLNLDNGFSDDSSFTATLSPPLLDITDSVFYPRMIVHLRHPYPGVQIRYSLDGSLPDSTHGQVYAGPLEIDSSAMLAARAFKSGWLGSRPANGQYLLNHRPDSIALLSKQDTNYKDAKGNRLVDGSIGVGDLNSDDGRWIGYIEKPAVVGLWYKKPVQVSQVVLYWLEQGAYANFPPARVQVWGGEDPAHLRLLASLHPDSLRQKDPEQVIHRAMRFPAASVRFLRLEAAPATRLPGWSDKKQKKPRLFISEILVS